MAQYTTTIERYTRNFGILNPKLNLEEQIEMSISSIFNFEFQWVNSDPTSLHDFEELFILHFWNQEIGFETMGLFKMKLREKFLRSMPKWKLYYDSLNSIMSLTANNPFYNILTITDSSRNLKASDDRTTDKTDKIGYDHTVGHDRGTSLTLSGSDTNSMTYGKKDTISGSGNTQNQQINSDNPQTNFAGVDYASSMTRGKDESSMSQTNQQSGTDNGSITYGKKEVWNGRDSDIYSGVDSTETNIKNINSSNEDETGNVTEKGYRGKGLLSELNKIRESFVPFYQVVLDDLDELFMGVFSNPYMGGGAW